MLFCLKISVMEPKKTCWKVRVCMRTQTRHRSSGISANVGTLGFEVPISVGLENPKLCMLIGAI